MERIRDVRNSVYRPRMSNKFNYSNKPYERNVYECKSNFNEINWRKHF